MTYSREEAWLLLEKYNGTETPAFETDRKRLVAGEPLGYVIGWVPFLNTKIWLDSHPLIPRSETEYWTERAIEKIRCAAPAAPRILDLCAGSGCIGIAVANAVPEAHVTFAELEKTHLPTITKNLQVNIPDHSNRMEYYAVRHSDLFEDISGTFDFILTNPPYIDPTLDRTEYPVKTHEPHTALYGGARGMEFIARIIKTAPEYLTEHSELWIEHEPEQSREVQQVGANAGLFVTTHTDQYDTKRYSVLVVQ